MTDGSGEADAAARRCDNCGAGLVGPHCHLCGAPSLDDRDLSLRNFAADAFEAVTSVEHGKILGTLTALLFRPGRLSVEFFTGRRIRYLRPLTLTLAMLALHLFAYSVTRAVTIYDVGKTATAAKTFAEQRKLDTKDTLATRMERKAAQLGVPREAVEKEINEQWARNVSLSQIPLILLFALSLQLFFLLTRRYFSEHLVFSMHFIAFQVLLQVLMWPFYYWLGTNLSGSTASIALAMYAIDLVYLFLATRTFYRFGPGKAVAATAAAFAAYFVIYLGLYLAAMQIAVSMVLAA